MHAVIFEVLPSEGRKQDYLEMASTLLPRLERVDGFISIERFESISQPGKVLSLSFWRDDTAIQEWRQIELQRAAQARGGGGIFKDYRLRVATVVRDYGMTHSS